MNNLKLNFKSLLPTAILSMAVISCNANAVVYNTLNGVNYEWLELSETLYMTRYEVEAQLADVDSSLYGYEYASRILVQDLLQSYTSWDGLDGWHGDSEVVDGVLRYMNDFGYAPTWFEDSEPQSFTTVDGYTVSYVNIINSTAMYGQPEECFGAMNTCAAEVSYMYDADGVPVAVLQGAGFGWDAFEPGVRTGSNDTISWDAGSHLVRVSSVPIPAAAWLFASGLLGLIAVARRKT